MLTLHLGMPKTATTAAQHALAGAEAALRARGLDYLAAFRSRNPAAHHDLPIALRASPEEAARMHALFLATLRAAEAERLLVSSEGLITLFPPVLMPRLLALLREAAAIRPLSLVLAIRRIDDFFASMYLHQIKVGTASGPVGPYLASRDGWIRRFFAALAELRAGVPGRLDLPVYRAGGDFLPSLWPRLGLSPEEAALLDRAPAKNARLGLKAQSLLAHLDRFTAETGLRPATRLRLVRLLETEPAVIGETAEETDPVPAATRRALHETALAAAREAGVAEYVEAFGGDALPDLPVRELAWDLLSPADIARLAAAGRAAGALVDAREGGVSRAKRAGGEAGEAGQPEPDPGSGSDPGPEPDPPRPVILHYHLFKNAGTSLDAVLKENFPGGWVAREFEGTPQARHPAAVADWIAEEAGAAAFSSHTAQGPLPVLPGVRLHSVLFLRNALDRIRSAHGFERKQAPDATVGAEIARRTDLEGYVRARLDLPGDRFCADFHVARLAAFVPEAEHPGLSELDRACLALDRIGLVGLVEEFDLSLALLARDLAPDFPEFRALARHANRGGEAERPLSERLARMRADLSPATWEMLLEKNAGDAVLHDRALARLRERAAEAGLPVPGPLAAPALRRGRPPLVLGVARNHDAGAALFEGQEFRVLAEAERVTGEKHATGPEPLGPAVAAALAEIGAGPEEVSAVVLAETATEMFDRLDPATDAALHRPGLAPLAALGRRDRLSEIAPHGIRGLETLNPDIEVFAACHHLAHAAGAVQQSGFGAATVVVADGYGSCCGTAAYRFDGRFERIEALTDSTLLGWRHLAFGAMAREIDCARTHVLDLSGKVMGLNAYGTAREDLSALLAERWFDGDAEAYREAWRIWNGKGLTLPDGTFASRGSHSVADQGFLDLTASMQEAFSRRMLALCEAAVAATGLPRLVLSGGCAVNVLANTRIVERFGAENVWVQPNASDSGLPIGAAALGAAHLAGRPVSWPVPEDAAALARRRDPFRGLSPRPPAAPHDDLVSEAAAEDDPATAPRLAALLAAEEVIGVIRGRGETGPRALGARSLLAGACGAGMREVLNFKIKHREWWRPFAPVCRLEDFARFFEGEGPSETMLTTVRVRPEWRDRIAAACHEDGTARLQVVAGRAGNPLLWDILGEYGARTGVPVLINTSFNPGGKPILNGFDAAAEMLRTTRLDGFWFAGRLWRRARGEAQPLQEDRIA